MSNIALGEWLKQQTRPDHHQLDQHPVLKPLLSRQLTLTTYGTALVALHRPIACLEQTLCNSFSQFGVDYSLTLRETSLAADIEQLGKHIPVLGHPTPLCVLPPPTNIAEVVGMLYVLEGSRLGGAMIGRHIERVLGDQVPLRFFTAQPLEAAHWAVFWQFADQYCPEDAWPAVLAGARLAFGYFIKDLNAVMTTNPMPKE